MEKFTYNDQSHAWERVDRIQNYGGCKIETVTYHADYFGADNSREYRVTWPDGHQSVFGINKRGGNIKELKKYIDFKAKYELN